VLDARSAQSLQDDERLVAMANEVASRRDDNASLRGELEKAKDALAKPRPSSAAHRRRARSAFNDGRPLDEAQRLHVAEQMEET
jgi:hypothetical protein